MRVVASRPLPVSALHQQSPKAHALRTMVRAEFRKHAGETSETKIDELKYAYVAVLPLHPFPHCRVYRLAAPSLSASQCGKPQTRVHQQSHRQAHHPHQQAHPQAHHPPSPPANTNTTKHIKQAHINADV